jgi:undecaprenyl-diphosphatase
MDQDSLSREKLSTPFYVAVIREIRASYYILGLMALFLVIAVFVHLYGTFSFDIEVSRMVQSIRSPFMDLVMTGLSALGTIGPLVLAVLLVARYMVHLCKNVSAMLAVASLLSYPLNVLIKNGVERVRPTSALIRILSPAGGYSFPSGHAMISMTVYGTLAYLLWVHSTARHRRLIPAVTAVVILLIGLSRIYLGVHWFSDVFGGWVAGAILVLAVIRIQKRLIEKQHPENLNN